MRLSLLHRLLITVLVAFGLNLGSTAPALACSCAGADTAQHFDSSDVIVTGTLTGPDGLGPGAGFGQTVTYRVAVDTVFKGSGVPEQLTISSAANGASCGLEFIESGRKYAVFATGPTNNLRAGLCGGTTRLTPALSRELTELSPGATAPVPGRAGPSDPDIWPLTAMGVTGAVVALGVWVLWRRRTNP